MFAPHRIAIMVKTKMVLLDMIRYLLDDQSYCYKMGGRDSNRFCSPRTSLDDRI
jgi:hypothetical protein